MKEGTGRFAHHIVNSTNRFFSSARALLDKYQIDINSAINGANLTGNRHYRQMLHSEDAANYITNELRMAERAGKNWAESRQLIGEKLHSMRQEMTRGSFKKRISK